MTNEERTSIPLPQGRDTDGIDPEAGSLPQQRDAISVHTNDADNNNNNNNNNQETHPNTTGGNTGGAASSTDMGNQQNDNIILF